MLANSPFFYVWQGKPLYAFGLSFLFSLYRKRILCSFTPALGIGGLGEGGAEEVRNGLGRPRGEEPPAVEEKWGGTQRGPRREHWGDGVVGGLRSRHFGERVSKYLLRKVFLSELGCTPLFVFLGNMRCRSASLLKALGIAGTSLLPTKQFIPFTNCRWY